MMRFDPTTNDWVIFAPSRALRPDNFKRAAGPPLATDESKCPFCPSHETQTPPEIVAVRDGGPANSPGWKVRVMPNKFPALRIEADHRRQQVGRLFRDMGGCGAHEVIVDSPDHHLTLAEQPVEQICLLLKTLQARYHDLMRDPRFQVVVIFKNHGERAGTSLAHPHCQLIATVVVPHMLRHKQVVAAEHFNQTGECLYCALLAEELATRDRLVCENEHFVAFAPYASRTPFELQIQPRLRQSSFGWVDPSLFRPLAEVLKSTLEKLHHGLGNPDFNLTIDTVPRGEEDAEYFSWHIQIVPRLTTPAGFELGSGMSINTVLPEAAAEFLRNVPTSTGA